MNLHYFPVVDDWLDVLRASPGSAWNVIQFLLTFVPLFLLGCVLDAEGFVVIAWICIASSIGIAFATYEVPRHLQRRLFKTASAAKGEWLVTISAEGIASTRPHVEAKYGWGAFTRFRETKVVFVLFASPRQIGFWIPKRAMSQEQIQELRRLLETKFAKS
jgi:YcxB-like protein